jgi:WD40 repeat protein
MISGGYDGQLIWWPVSGENPEPVRKIDSHTGWIRAVAVSPDGKLVASAGNDRLVKLWSVADGSLVQELRGHESQVYNVAFHPDGKGLVTGDHKCNLIHWEVADGKMARQFKLPSLHKYDESFKADIGGFLGLTFSADGKRLLASGITNVTNAFAGVGNPQVIEVEWESGKELIQHESKAKVQGVAWGVATHPENVTIGVSGGPGGGFLLFWKPDQKEEFFQFKLPGTGRDMDLAPDLLHVVVAHYDRKVRVYRLDLAHP